MYLNVTDCAQYMESLINKAEEQLILRDQMFL